VVAFCEAKDSNSTSANSTDRRETRPSTYQLSARQRIVPGEAKFVELTSSPHCSRSISFDGLWRFLALVMAGRSGTFGAYLA